MKGQNREQLRLRPVLKTSIVLKLQQLWLQLQLSVRMMIPEGFEIWMY